MNKKFVKICIFNPDSTPSAVKTSNGDVILDNICLQAITDEILDTGEYYLDCKFKVDNKLYKYIQEESILKVKVDYGNEYFRIAKIRKTSRDIVVFARQITISETLDMWLEDVRPEGQNGQGALSWILDNSKGKKDIRVFSDLENNSTAYYINMSMYKALHDCDQSFKNRWGGEIQRRGYDLTINRKIGKHRGVQIRSRKNLKGFESNTNIDNLVTRIKPVGFNGITIDGYVDSPLINTYSSVKTREIKYEDVKVKTENDKEGFDTLADAQQELIKRANLEFTVNNLDKIRADYRVNFVQLEYTEEYKNYVQAERVYLGDEIDVYEETLDVDITVRSIRKRFDVISQKVIEIELSNEVKKDKPPSIGDISNALSKLETTTNEKSTWLENAINNANDLIHNGLKDSYVIVKQNEVLIMDTTDINTANNVWRWNAGGLAHSKNGYYGDYSTAITQDGSIVANMITSGILNANLLQTGVIRSKNKNFELNLDSGVMKVLNGSFKLMVDGEEEDLITKSAFEANNDRFEFKFFNNTDNNKLRNTSFFNNWNYWGWNGSFEKFIYHDGNFPKGDTVRLEFTEENQGLFQTGIDCTHGVAIRVYANASRPINITIGIEGIYEKVFTIGQGDGWSELDLIVPPIPRTGTFIFYTKAGGPHTVYANRFKIQTGDVCTPWVSHADEIYSNKTIIDNEGMKIKHDNGSMSKFTHEAIDFLNSQGLRTLRVKDGGLNFYTYWDPAEMVAFIKSSSLGSTSWNGATLSTYGNGDYISIGTSSSVDENAWKSDTAIIIVPHANIQEYPEIGTWFVRSAFFKQIAKFKAGAKMDYGNIEFNSNSEFPHLIYNSTSNNFCVMGDNSLKLGIREGTVNRNIIDIEEDGSQINKGYVHNWASWNFHGHKLENVNMTYALQPQTSFLRAMSFRFKEINESYAITSMTNGDIRLACRDNQIISSDNKKLIVELPQIFAENIESNYHLNISKMSWGDYRIIEKNPYYFEIETNTDNFSFTYEVVAKLIEKPDANTSIAKSQYMVQESNEVNIENDEIKSIIEI
ncbi:MAG: phage tail spike protein [Paraclostridium sp.]